MAVLLQNTTPQLQTAPPQQQMVILHQNDIVVLEFLGNAQIPVAAPQAPPAPYILLTITECFFYSLFFNFGLIIVYFTTFFQNNKCTLGA
jgi:hypothetical protein